MLFSEYFKIDLNGNEPWFDPILSLDTPLFIDPFLIFQDEFGVFEGAHQEIMGLYSVAFELIAEAGEAKSEVPWKKAISILGSPEVAEVCLGVTAEGTRGAGAGQGKAKQIANAFYRAIQFGISNPKHFEAVQLFEEGIAQDTISDAVANILRHRLSAYTKIICEEYGIETKEMPHLRGCFNPATKRWERIVCDAPINPYSGRQIFLVPKQYLRPMPSLNPDDFWGFCYDQSAQELRTEMGEEITRNVNKEVIIEKALKDFDSVVDYMNFLERIGGTPYDLENDPKGLIKWYHASRDFVADNPIDLSFSTKEEFSDFIDRLLEIFKNYVENQGGWELLYNDDGKPKSERACQRLFLGIVLHYCIANDIDLSPEVNIGRGPVDFKLSKGVEFRALVEMKLARNTKFWDGLKKQLPMYLKAEGVSQGRFLIVAFNEKDVERLKDIYEKVADVKSETGYHISHSLVEAPYKPLSASKL